MSQRALTRSRYREPKIIFLDFDYVLFFFNYIMADKVTKINAFLSIYTFKIRWNCCMHNIKKNILLRTKIVKHTHKIRAFEFAGDRLAQQLECLTNLKLFYILSHF